MNMSTKFVKLSDYLEEFTKNVSDEELLSSIILSYISMKIIDKRISLNMTRKEFAKFLNVSQSFVYKLENEEYIFTITKLVEVLNKLGLQLKLEIVNDNSCDKEKILNMYKPWNKVLLYT